MLETGRTNLPSGAPYLSAVERHEPASVIVVPALQLPNATIY